MPQNHLDMVDMIEFFDSQAIVPGDTALLTKHDYLSIMFNAIDVSDSFSAFVREVITSPNNIDYEMVVQTWQELIDVYDLFITGYAKGTNTLQ